MFAGEFFSSKQEEGLTGIKKDDQTRFPTELHCSALHRDEIMDQETPSTAEMLNASINETVAIASNRKHMYISEPFGMAITRLILFGLLFLAAVIGNYFVFTVFVRSRRLRTFSYCLVMNLAVSDFLVFWEFRFC